MFDMGKVSVLVKGWEDTFHVIRIDGKLWEFDSESWEYFIEKGNDPSRSGEFMWREMECVDRWGDNEDWILANEQIDRWEIEGDFVDQGRPLVMSIGAL